MLARLAWIASALLFAAIGGAQAQELDSVAKKLQATHTLTIGYRETSVPLSYLDKDNKPTGYAVEFCQKIGEAAKAALNLPELKFAYVPVTIQTRQALIANGTVDIVCDGTVHTWTRAKQVDFTPIHWVSAEQLLVLKSSRHQGRRRSEGQGGRDRDRRHERADGAAALNDERISMSASCAWPTIRPALLALESQRADAYLSDNAAFYSLIKSSHHPENLAIVGPELSCAAGGADHPEEQPDLRLDRRAHDVGHVQVGRGAKHGEEMVRPVRPWASARGCARRGTPTPSRSEPEAGGVNYTLGLGHPVPAALSGPDRGGRRLDAGGDGGELDDRARRRQRRGQRARRAARAGAHAGRRLCRSVPQRAAAGAAVPVVLRVPRGGARRARALDQARPAAAGIQHLAAWRSACLPARAWRSRCGPAIDAARTRLLPAALATGLRPLQAYRLVLLPVAFRTHPRRR